MTVLSEFEKNIERLKQIMSSCQAKDEENLKYYCECLLKMNVACCKIDKIEMLFYIRQVMIPTMPLVIDYFCEMLEQYRKEENEYKRIAILYDIERSVVEIGNVFETVVYATNGADRMLLQTAPITVGLNSTAPKLYAYYTSMLNRLTNILPKSGEAEYAFTVYPTLSSVSKAIVLFSEREQSGKVGVIRVPEKDITKVEQLSVILAHELFHIKPRESRFRKKRALAYLRVILYSFEMDLLGGIDDWSKDEKEAIRELLFEKVIDQITEKCRSKSDEDRFFYSTRLKEYFVNIFQQELWKVQNIATEEFVERMTTGKAYATWEEFNKEYKKAEERKQKIDCDIYKLLSRGEIKERCSFYMNIFREVYADLFSVITLRILPETYFSAFKDAPGDVYERVLLYLRTYFVVEIMCSNEGICKEGLESFFDRWKEWNNSEKQVVNTAIGSKTEFFAETVKEKTAFENKKNESITGIFINQAIIDVYKKYFIECCNAYLNFQKEHALEFEKFREDFMYGMDFSQNEILSKIAKRQWGNSQK